MTTRHATRRAWLARGMAAAGLATLSSGPAGAAGLRPGDVVLALGEKPVRSTAELLRAVAGLRPGTRAVVTVQRGSQRAQVPVTVGERPPPAQR